MVEIVLGEPGQAYMQSVLRHCTGAALHLAEIVSKPGKISALLPAGTTKSHALMFDVGGLPAKSNGLDLLFCDLTQKQGGTLFLQDIWSQPSDLKVRPPTVTTYVTDESSVYYYLPLFSLGPHRVANLQKQISSFQMVAFYIPGPLNLTFEQRRNRRVPVGHVESLALCASTVYVSAYDREAWVVWHSSALEGDGY